MTTQNSEHSHRDPEAHKSDREVVREYAVVWAILMVLLIVTVAAAAINFGEPWSFLIALTIAIAKAVLVILFFMHVKDASRVTWIFCSCSFLWLAILLVLTFGDYMTRPVPPKATVEHSLAGIEAVEKH